MVMMPGTVHIFLFHRVSPVRNAMWDPVDPLLFDRMIGAISRRFRVVQLERLLQGEYALQHEKRDIAAIVFDDGYQDNLEYALPVLKRHNCAASLYVITGCLTNGIPTWNYEVDYLIANTRKKEAFADNEIYKGPLSFNTHAERIRFSTSFKYDLKQIGNTLRLQIINELRTQLDDVAPPVNPMLNWDGARELYNEGIYIGSHTVTHPVLIRLTDEEIRRELSDSRAEIRANLGYDPVTVAYPMGYYNDRVKRIAFEAGYSSGLTVKEVKHSLGNDRLAITRIQLFNESWLKFQLRSRGYIHTIKRIIKR
jgi:peptidoglycan/xylan/chitin deacetylase (PgdA/CDA1 family)